MCVEELVMAEKPDFHLYSRTTHGEEIVSADDTIIIRFPSIRSVLSTSWINGGYREDVSAVIISHPPSQTFTQPDLKRVTVESYLTTISKKFQLDPSITSGLLTGASVKDAAIVTHSMNGIEITAVATSGFGKYDDHRVKSDDEPMEFFSDAVNIVLIIGAEIPDHDMVRAVTLAAEAKTNVFMELMKQHRLDSRKSSAYSTDGIVIIAQKNLENTLKNLKEYADIEDLIKSTVNEATRIILERIYPDRNNIEQNILDRLRRFSITEEDIFEKSLSMQGPGDKGAFFSALHDIAKQPSLLAAVTAVIHIMDEIRQNLVPEEAGKIAARKILRVMPEICGLMPDQEFLFLLRSDEPIDSHLEKIIAWIAKKKIS